MAEGPEHLDPTRVPPWLMEAAKQDHPSAIGWLASGYLAGVEVARKAGPCGEQLLINTPGAPVSVVACELAHGHLGDHRRVWTFMWSTKPAPLHVEDESGGDL